MAQLQAFKSAGQAGVTFAASATQQNISLPEDGETVVIVNATGVAVFIDFGTTSAPTVTSTSAAYVAAANSQMMVQVGRIGTLTCGVTPSASATGTVYAMRGDGSFR